MSQIVALTTLDSEAINISSTAIELVVEEGTFRKLYYDLKGAVSKQADVSEDLATIISDAQDVITLTFTENGKSILLSVPRIISIEAFNTGSKVFYEGKGADADLYIVDEDTSTIDGLVAAL